jgi:hypothetical protein
MDQIGNWDPKLEVHSVWKNWRPLQLPIQVIQYSIILRLTFRYASIKSEIEEKEDVLINGAKDYQLELFEKAKKEIL